MVKQHFFEICKATHPLLLTGMSEQDFQIPVGWHELVKVLLQKLSLEHGHQLKIERLWQEWGQLHCTTNQDGALSLSTDQIIEWTRVASQSICTVCGTDALAISDQTSSPVCWTCYEASTT